MFELSTYNLSDFILFSENVYYRQFSLYNSGTWPIHLFAIIFGIFALVSSWGKSFFHNKGLTLGLVIFWCWTAGAFLYLQFLQIHIVADWYALGFVIQALLMAWLGGFKQQFENVTKSKPRKIIGRLVLVFAIFLYPFIAVLTGRNWLEFELFGMAPDPTALGTLGILILHRVSWVLYIIPVIWLVISYITIYVM